MNSTGAEEGDETKHEGKGDHVEDVGFTHDVIRTLVFVHEVVDCCVDATAQNQVDDEKANVKRVVEDGCECFERT